MRKHRLTHTFSMSNTVSCGENMECLTESKCVVDQRNGIR